MFDPFGDFQNAGYLRNIEGLKDPQEIKVQEHLFFEANLEEALVFLGSIRGKVRYRDFLRVHAILFSDFYPWAGQDRHALGVARLVGRGTGLQFEASELCQRAVEWGLDMGNDVRTLRDKPGTVMGAFAWGHPFLDGNGRSMLLIHAELCHRAGFAIDWRASNKEAYLQALTLEIQNPQDRHLDTYLRPLITAVGTQATLLEHLLALPGLNGQADVRQAGLDIAYHAEDQQAVQAYLEMKRARGEPAA
ncbi:Fic family protein [Delftia acidovorans]|uniref:protein adenylyltransferase n=1 Tax=Delftia acidovorans TaxID=80866 RepID=A0A7T2VYZ3_DELAC|nr:Fic family protein [Delftia acidovorans]QPS08606.1 Fic family protein [Delftia acidovorans]